MMFVPHDAVTRASTDTPVTVGIQPLLHVYEVDGCRLAANAPAPTTDAINGPGPLHLLLVVVK